MNELRIIGLLITDRIKEAGLTQEILTKHANIIKSRLGFHEVNEDKCSRIGFILLQITGNQQDYEELESELSEIGGIEIQRMIFRY
jgi:metal-responsive CopG/Arc/MetJ family transcriptional regulator